MYFIYYLILKLKNNNSSKFQLNLVAFLIILTQSELM